jgi:3-oxoacyl-[acyl-carrier protein] reductase
VAAAVRAAALYLGERGRIISIGSGAGSHSPWRGIADYSATKAAVAAYTRGWARDLGSKGITVNVIQPGPIDTDMNPANGALAEVQKAGTALGRYGKPEEVADCGCVFGESRGRFHYRCDARCRWRVQRLTL